MSKFSILSSLVAILFGAYPADAQEEDASDPVTQILRRGNEAKPTGVLGGWPPENYARGGAEGSGKVDQGLMGETDQPLKLADNSPGKKVGKEREEQATVPADASKSKDKEAVQPISDLFAKEVDTSELELPELPEPVDQIKPAIPEHRKPSDRPRSKKDRPVYPLGPGDQITFSTFDREDLKRTVTVAPDGTVSYLQAIAVDIDGLTVDQARQKMEAELRKYRTDLKLIVNPQSMQSQQYAILGRVKQPGTYTLDRPTTVLEGIARAQGVQVGTIRGSAIGLADLGHSFVSRRGQKLDVEIAKLYHEGDLSQNVQLQPEDYIYIASVLKNEFYVLGQVNNPGRVKMPHKITVAKAISMAGGFSNAAYRMKVLVVRGDIHAPDVHVVNVRDVLEGNALDIEVENRDIIFVARRPFEFLERVVDSAITTYVQTLTAEAMNQNYNPFSL